MILIAPSQRKEDNNMSQTRQPIQIAPKITLKLGVWGRVGLVLAIITAIASYILYHNGVRYKDREKAHFQELSQQIQRLQQAEKRNIDEKKEAKHTVMGNFVPTFTPIHIIFE